MPSNNKKSENNGKDGKDAEMTLKEASSKLDISESTVKKYLKDFDLKIEKGSFGKQLISKDTFEALSEIAKLRTNGLSIQEIKELKSQGPSKNILEEIEEKPSQDSLVEAQEDISREEDLSLRDESLDKDIDLEKEPLADEGEGDTQDDQQMEEQEGEEGVRRRRGFNYRYVERQVSYDSKKVSSLRIRLKNPNLSIQDRMFFEEALERRILFLNGWKHILRWISMK